VLALLAGAATALGGLAVCALVGLVGWYLSDAGSHGAPRAGLVTGVRGWLVGHGAGITVDGVSVTVLPLGITALLAWSCWQAGLRLGEAVWSHGPDVHRLGDGERDWTVPTAVAWFTVAYLVVAQMTTVAVSGDGFSPHSGRVLGWSLLLSLVAAAPGIAVGSGRAAQWAATVPAVVRHSLEAAGRVLVAWLGLATLLLVVALVVSFPDVLDVFHRLGTTAGESFLLTLGNLVLLPTAVLWSSAFLLGPGFAVGTGTVVAPSAVVLGPLPLLPALGALPEAGTPPAWWAAHLAAPVVLAAVVVARHRLSRPTLRWDEGVLGGCAAGLLAALALTVLTAVAGGAAGPGRMAEVGPFTGEVLTHALTSFGLGGLLGGAVATWWLRRTAVPAEESEAADAVDASPADEDDATTSHPAVDDTTSLTGLARGSAPAGPADPRP